MVLFLEKMKLKKGLRPLIKSGNYKVTFDTAFEEVVRACALGEEREEETWIIPERIEVALSLHRKGQGHSVEVWNENMLVGGLYGIYLKEKMVFCGESMFSRVSNASKFAFIKLVEKLNEEGVKLIDCQIYTEHLESLGAEEISRKNFLKYLK